MDHTQPKQVLLILDGSTENVSVMRTILAPEYNIKVAGDEDEVIRLASSANSPKLILLSNMMPTADIYEVCRKLKSNKISKDIPIIILSEPTRKDTEAMGFEIGVADYISKPFKRSVVRARIRTHLELRGYREDIEKSLKKRSGKLYEEIQERKNVEESYHAIVEHTRDGIVIIHNYTVLYSNPAFCKMLGYSEKELVGAHLKKFISEEEFIKNTSRYSDRIGGLNLPRIYKSKVVHSDGSTIDVELNVSVVPYGRSLAALVFVRDIREEEAWKYSI